MGGELGSALQARQTKLELSYHHRCLSPNHCRSKWNLILFYLFWLHLFPSLVNVWLFYFPSHSAWAFTHPLRRSDNKSGINSWYVDTLMIDFGRHFRAEIP